MNAGDTLAGWASSSPLMAQVDEIADILAKLSTLRERGNLHAPAAALDAAHAVLCLAVATAADEDEAMIRHEAVTDALPALAQVGLGHVQELVKAALAHGVVAGRLVRTTDRLQ